MNFYKCLLQGIYNTNISEIPVDSFEVDAVLAYRNPNRAQDVILAHYS